LLPSVRFPQPANEEKKNEKRLLTTPLLASIILTILLASQLSIVVLAPCSQTVQKKHVQRVSSLVIESTLNPSEPNQVITISGKVASGRAQSALMYLRAYLLGDK